MINKETSNQYNNEMIEACTDGNIQEIGNLISLGANVNYKDEDDVLEWTPLVYSCRAEKNTMETVVFLLQNGADVTAFKKLTYTLLVEGARFGFEMYSLFEKLNNKYDMSTYLNNILYEACNRGDIQTVKHLIAKGADASGRTNTEDSVCKYTMPHGACGNEKHGVEILNLLVKNGADVNAPSQTAIGDVYPIHSAINVEVVKFLVSLGVDINFIDNGRNLFFNACFWNGKNDIISYLIDNGIDINQQDNRGNTGIHLQVLNAYYKPFKSAIGIYYPSDVSFESAFIRVKDKISMLIAAGCDVRALNNEGKSPMDIALEKNKPELAEFLKEFQKSA